MNNASVPTIRFDIFMAGDLAQAKQVCREYCFNVGLCVNIAPVDYIYVGGEEMGFRISLLNYPRFPANHDIIRGHAKALAGVLLKRLCQHSYMIVGPATTEWITLRPDTEQHTARHYIDGGVTP